MNNITVDSRRCGAGKTTDANTGIYSKIRNHISSGHRVLVVVPSIALQDQYMRDLNKISWFRINHTTHANTATALYDAMRSGRDAIIITAQTFTQTSHRGYRANYHLIIDEALEGIVTTLSLRYNTTGQWRPDLDIENVFCWVKSEHQRLYELDQHEDTELYPFRVYRTPQDNIITESQSFRQMTNENYTVWMTANTWTALRVGSDQPHKMLLVLNTDILDMWRSVHIAAAAFEHTAMGHWLRSSGVPYHIESAYVPHEQPIRLHSPNLVWSKSLMMKQPELLPAWQEYVDKTRTGPVLSARNIIHGKDGRHMDDIPISHNAHGLNAYTQYWNISLETALVPDPLAKKWMTDNWFAGMNEHDIKRKITNLWATYKFYQLVLRTGYRLADHGNNVLDVFVMDEGVAVGFIAVFFQDAIIRDQIDIGYTKPQRGRKHKYATEEERIQARREQIRNNVRQLRDKRKM
jgi:hypothetical protein